MCKVGTWRCARGRRSAHASPISIPLIIPTSHTMHHHIQEHKSSLALLPRSPNQQASSLALTPTQSSPAHLDPVLSKPTIHHSPAYITSHGIRISLVLWDSGSQPRPTFIVYCTHDITSHDVYVPGPLACRSCFRWRTHRCPCRPPCTPAAGGGSPYRRDSSRSTLCAIRAILLALVELDGEEEEKGEDSRAGDGHLGINHLKLYQPKPEPCFLLVHSENGKASAKVASGRQQH